MSIRYCYPKHGCSMHHNVMIVILLFVLSLFNVCESFTTSSPQVPQHHNRFVTRTTTTQSFSQLSHKTSNSIHNINSNQRLYPTITAAAKITTRHNQRLRPLQVAAASIPAIVSSFVSPIGSLLVLVLLILIHECGHYIAARSLSIKVDEFSIGVGPKVTGFTAFGNDFNIRALPLGGYVKFPENYNSTANRIADFEEEKEFNTYIRSLNLNIVTQVLNAFTLGLFLENKWNKEKEIRQQKAQEEEEQKSKQFLLQFWNNQKKTSTPVTATNNDREYYDDRNLLQNRPALERAIVLSGGIVFNLLTALTIYFGIISYGTGIPQPVFSEGIVVTTQPAIDTAASGKLNRGDVIVGINSIPMNTLSSSPTASESNQAINDFISKIRTTPSGESVTLQVKQISSSSQLKEIQIQPKQMNINGPQTIGISLAPNYIKTEYIKSDSIITAFILALKYVISLTSETLNGLLTFFNTLLFSSSNTNNGNTQQLSGPIGLIRTGTEIINSSSNPLNNILLFMAAISINLAVVNALPIPALDGGQLIFILLEAITQRKVISQKLEENITSIAVLFLIYITANTLFSDISNLIFQ